MFSLNKTHQTPLATRWGVFKPGRDADLSKVPKAVRDKWIEEGTFVQNDSAPDLFEDMPEDGLSALDRDQLKHFIVNNKIPLRVKQKWSDEEIRQAIRELTDPKELDEMLKAPSLPENPASTSPQS